MKRKIYETGRVSTLHEMKSFFITIRGLFPVIDTFIRTHCNELVNSAIADNGCYSISFGEPETVVYLKMQ